jgi:hypothetical protein
LVFPAGVVGMKNPLYFTLLARTVTIGPRDNNLRARAKPSYPAVELTEPLTTGKMFRMRFRGHNMLA